MFSSSSKATIDGAIAKATADPYHAVPRLSVLVASPSELLYSGSGGYSQLPKEETKELSELPRFTEATPVELWSGTKLLTCIAVLQLLEKGLLKLEDDASQWAEELNECKIYGEVNDDGEVIYEENDAVITIQHLLAHTSGPPGKRWHYGQSFDWLGFIVENITGIPLEDYFKANIFEPLGITDMTYLLDPAKANLVVSSTESPCPTEAPHLVFEGPQPALKANGGGLGLSGSASSFMKVLQMILSGGTSASGQTVLQKSSVDLLFEEQLETAEQKEDLEHYLTLLEMEPFSGKKKGAFEGVNWGFGGLLSGDGMPSGRTKGALSWTGAQNTFWVVDREKKVCFLIFTSMYPYGFAGVMEAWRTIEVEVYKEVGASVVVGQAL
ncbi:beta-lactamase [Pseudohyphozyma bogoriensis]|nr:beta-lactamase [Pseudohyphozyma bogoriensis]